MKMKNGSTFVKITNREIYDVLQKIHEDIDIIKQQLKVNKYMSSLAITISLMVAGALIGKYI